MKERKYVDPNEAFVVHPDVTDGFITYNGDPDHFKKVFRGRNKKLQDGEEYWNSDHDVEMQQTAEERSKKPGWMFPRRKKK